MMIDIAQELWLIKAGNKMRAVRQTVAVAESVTAGLLQQSLAAIENASEFFQGGMTVYNLGQKCTHLGIEPIEAQQCNCVSVNVAKQMAIGVAQKFTADWGMSLTGYATPVPESGQKLFAYYAICFNGKIKAQGLLRADIKDPAQVQQQYVHTILKKWVACLNKYI